MGRLSDESVQFNYKAVWRKEQWVFNSFYYVFDSFLEIQRGTEII